MNVSNFLEMAYKNKSNWTLGENKPKQTQFQRPISAPKEWQENMETSSCLTVAVPDNRHWDRWIVELCLRDIKTTLGMDILRGKSADVVRKDIYICTC